MFATPPPSGSAFNDSYRPQTGDFLRNPRPINDINNLIDILVSGRLFLCEAFVTPRSDNNSDRVKFLVDPAISRETYGGRPAHHSACAVASCPERLRHTSGQTGQDPARRSHAPRNDDGLTRGLIGLRNLGMAWRKGARGSFSVDADILAATVSDIVILKFGNVVRDVVNQFHSEPIPVSAKHLSKDLAGLMSQ